jgi:hypothetical protein
MEAHSSGVPSLALFLREKEPGQAAFDEEVLADLPYLQIIEANPILHLQKSQSLDR